MKKMMILMTITSGICFAADHAERFRQNPVPPQQHIMGVLAFQAAIAPINLQNERKVKQQSWQQQQKNKKRCGDQKNCYRREKIKWNDAKCRR